MIDSLRGTFERELKEVEDMVMAMGLTVMEMLKKSMLAFKKEDTNLVDEVIKMDDTVDKYNIDIEKRCLELIATQQPMAHDLRFIASTMRIISDIERMGDYTVDVVKFAKRLFNSPKLAATATVPHMAELTVKMLQETLDAISRKDLNLITKMIEDDDQVDAALKKVFDEVLADIEKDSKTAKYGIYLILMARYIERIADHITNVGERTHYTETGEFKELHL